MSEKDEIDTSGIATLFGIPKTNCASVVDHVDGFPAPIRLDRTRRVYSLKQIKSWAKTQKHPAETLRQAYRDFETISRYGHNPKAIMFIARSRAFITGQFMTTEQKREHAARLQAARAKPRPRPVVVTVNSEWAQCT